MPQDSRLAGHGVERRDPAADHLDPKRLRWACRRGMLELDALFNQFLDQGYARLSPKEQADFVQLLAQDDQSLWTWFLGHAQPIDPRFRHVIERVRATAQA